MITDQQIEQFREQGYFLIPNPLSPRRMDEISRLERAQHDAWQARNWTDGVNILACKLLMLGEPVLSIIERTDLLDSARRLLGCDDVRVIACGAGDTHEVSPKLHGVGQIPWHSDGEPSCHMVSFRVALDVHDQQRGPLRVLPGSHRRPRAQIEALLPARDNDHGAYGRIEGEVEVELSPGDMLMWTPVCWHATGPNHARAVRRAMGWNYAPADADAPCRDVKAVKQVYEGQWESWPATRRRLWGLIDR